MTKRSKKNIFIRSFKVAGFTLIEILLVVVILTVVAALVISLYQKHATSSKIDKTVLDLQGMMQAASAYYIAHNNTWPYPTAAMPTQFMPIEYVAYLPTPQYIPTTGNPVAQILTNPFGKYYYIDGHMNSSKKTFLITTQVPDMNIAKQIAARLPFGQAMSSGAPAVPTVYVSVALPGLSQVTYNENVIIQATGTTSPISNGESYQLPTFTCPAGWIGNTAVMLNFIEAQSVSGSAEDYCQQQEKRIISNLTPNLSCSAPADPSGNYLCTLKPTLETRYSSDICYSFNTGNYGKVAYTYIAYCYNPSTSS